MVEEWWEARSEALESALEEMSEEFGVDPSEILLCDLFDWVERRRNNDQYSC